MKRLIYYIFFISGLFLASCTQFKEAECTGVKGFKVNSITMTGIEAEVILGIKNPNKVGFSIYPCDFDIALSSIGLGQAKLKKRVHINANTEKNYTFKLNSNFKDLNMMDITKLMNSGGVKGTIQVKGNLKGREILFKEKLPC